MATDSAYEDLSEAEATELERYFRRFNYRGAGRGLGLEPWYLDGRIPREAPEVERVELARCLCAAMRGAVGEAGYLHYVDWQHRTARFYPDRSAELDLETLFLDGDSGGWFATDRAWGIVAFDWTPLTVVAFYGEAVVARLRHDRPALLERLLPIDPLAD